jgi:homoserine dehydrogenase
MVRVGMSTNRKASAGPAWDNRVDGKNGVVRRLRTGQGCRLEMQQVNLGLIGGGTVGGGVWRALERNGGLIASRLGISLRVTRVAVRDIDKARPGGPPRDVLTSDWKSVVNDPAIHVVVELAGGVTTAREIALATLKAGKPLVTANKALLSAHGEALFAAAARHGANIYYEASVAGGIPIIKVLRESLVGNRVATLHGIVNGTCNFILTRMKASGASFASALAEAQRLGYAEADPTLDVDGHDAAHKTGILASLAHGFWVNPAHISTEGIRGIEAVDIEFASQLGYTIKLLGVVKDLTPTGTARRRVQVAVYPALVPDRHVLASVGDAFNAIAVRGDVVGDTLFYGRGAGADATASSVLSDLADAALDLKHGSHRRVPPFVAHDGKARVAPMDDVLSRYYLRLSVVDRPGVFARVAAILARAKIGISSIIQPEGHAGEAVPIILMIHEASGAAMRRALKQIARLPVVRGVPNLIRVEPFE